MPALKKKHSKTGEESRFQGTMLGKDLEDRPIQIDGGLESIHAWELQRHQASKSSKPASARSSSAPLSAMSSPLSEV
jgi:transcription initiation factor TFIID subunit 3